MGVAIAKDLEAVLMRSKVLADSALRMESSPHQAGDRDKVRGSSLLYLLFDLSLSGCYFQFLDVLIAFILIECKRARPVFTVVRQKVKTNCWDEPLIDTAFRFPEVCHEFDESRISLSLSDRVSLLDHGALLSKHYDLGGLFDSIVREEAVQVWSLPLREGVFGPGQDAETGK